MYVPFRASLHKKGGTPLYYTYQDLLQVGDSDEERMEFARNVISSHMASQEYRTAKIADDYSRRKNRTIMEYQKVLYTVTGAKVPDTISSNYKLCSNFFHRFVTQENQYLLGNGVQWEDATKEKLGKNFDSVLQRVGKHALIHGRSFGFFNKDHLEEFTLLEFAPLEDEETGALRAGVRFWQIDVNKPLRATLYTEDGATDYIWYRRKGTSGDIEEEGQVLHAKQPYIVRVDVSQAEGERIVDGQNYPSFPIVPLWGNQYHQSELVGLREQIDVYDLIKSGYANDVEDCAAIYWTISNAGGMDDVDLATFINHIKTVKGAIVDQNGASAQPHTVSVPYESREALLARLERDMYRDSMALDPYSIAGGAATATQIRAAYEPLNSKTDEYEYCVLDFLHGIMRVAGIDDNPSFTRSTVVNTQEEIQVLVQTADFLPRDYITTRILSLFGDTDKAEEVIEQAKNEEMERFETALEQQRQMQEMQAPEEAPVPAEGGGAE